MSEYKFYSDMSFAERSCHLFPHHVAMSKSKLYSGMSFVEPSCSSCPRPVATSEYKFGSDMSFVEPSGSSFPHPAAMSEYKLYSGMSFVEPSCSSFPRPVAMSEYKCYSDMSFVDEPQIDLQDGSKYNTTTSKRPQIDRQGTPQSDLQEASKRTSQEIIEMTSKSTTLGTNSWHTCSRTEPNSQTFPDNEREGRRDWSCVAQLVWRGVSKRVIE